MKTLTNGKVTVQVADHKAEHFSRVLGMRIVDDTPKVEEAPEAPKPKRGRPRKVN